MPAPGASATTRPSPFTATCLTAPTSKLAQRLKRPGTSAPAGGKKKAPGNGWHENGGRVGGDGARSAGGGGGGALSPRGPNGARGRGPGPPLVRGGGGPPPPPPPHPR